MSRPTRPDWPAYPTIVTPPREEVKHLTSYIHDLRVYITAIEQERDEAVDIIRAIRDSGALDDIDPPGSEWFDESQWSVNRRVDAFLARFKGAAMVDSWDTCPRCGQQCYGQMSTGGFEPTPTHRCDSKEATVPDENRIEEGDIVLIGFSNGDAIFDAKVLYTPAATGDSWRVRDNIGDLYYVQTFETMKLIRKEGSND